MKKALFWDFDGTLIHANTSFFDALSFSLKKNGYEVPAEQLKELLLLACSWNSPEISYTENIGAEWWDSLFCKFKVFYKENNIDNDAIHDKINQCFKEWVFNYKNYTLYKDSEFILSKCRQNGYKNYILSNNFPELPKVIEDLGISKYFDGYIISSNTGYEKPRTELFEYALKIAGNPQQCFMIGDNPIADIQGGNSAKIKTILVNNDASCNADYKCRNLIDIFAVLDLV